ncbi:S8 family serine peptidase [Gottfriedia acidiceleris]|uniref:S8 family serine peptidase n=1 Tax=Gottfriedia acidiceleris TaxID=371036 RepID=UPI003D21403F
MKKQVHKSRIIKSFTVLSLYSGFILGSLGHVTTVSKAASYSKVNEMIANLTQSQRAALNQLSTSNETGLQISSEIDLESSNQTNVIVEFKNKPAKVAQIESSLEGKQLSENEASNLVDQDHLAFDQDVNEILTDKNNEKVDFKINRSYKHAFNGVSMSLPANQIQNLLKSKVVKVIWSNEEVHSEPDVSQEEVQTGRTTNNSSLSFLGVDKLHEEGFTGKGVKVGVIDTGVDYNHPDLKGAFKGGYDFVDNDNNPMETTYEDWKKSGMAEFFWANGASYYTEHGTHVAGIIAGQGKNESEYKKTGIAPDADLYAYRVLGRYGSGTTENVIAGIDKAVEDGMDVINLSLGANLNNPLYSTSIAINQAVLSGVTAVIAAGNTGNDMYTVGSPGSAALALTVGASSEPTNLHTFKGSLQNGTETVSADLQEMAKGYTDHIEELNGKTFPVVYVGLGSQADYKNKDVKDKVVLVSRGSITLNDKARFAKQNGASAVLIYNNNPTEGQIPAYIGEGLDYIPAFSLTYDQGIALKTKLNTVSTFTFNQLGQLQKAGDELADFSSRGPSRITYDIKPEVTAPGVGVFSTVPAYMINKEKTNDYQYSYQRLSGTSMASPNVAGVAALLLQANPKLEPSDVKAILMNTANPLKKSYSVYEVGAGRIDAYKAVHSTIEIKVLDETPMIKKDKEKLIKEETGAISFGSVDLSDDVNEDRTLNLHNSGDEEKIFDVAVKFQTGLGGAKDAQKNGLLVKVEPTIKLGAKQQRKTTASIFIPKTAEKGLYEGYIVYTNENHPEETYRVPFGVHAVEEGVSLFQLSSMGISEDRYRDPYSSPYTNKSIASQIQFNSNMRDIDFTLVDGTTNKDLGYLGYMDGITKSEDVLYDVQNVFKGIYYPFDDNSANGIGSIPVVANEGFYKIKMVATGDNGKQFIELREVVVDRGKPKFSFDGPETRIVEYEEGQKSVTISGSIFDQEIENFRAAGMNIDRSANKILDLNVGQGEPPIEMPVNKDGSFKYEVPVGLGVKTLKLAAVDPAGNGSVVPEFIRIVKKGTPYLAETFDKSSVKPNDLVNVKIVLKNAVNFKKINFNFSTSADYFTIENVKLHPDSSKLGELKLTRTPSNNLTIETADGNTQTLNGDLTLAEATLRAKDYKFDIRPDGATFNTSTISYQNRLGNTTYLFSNTPNIEFVPIYSKVRSILYGEGLLNKYGTFDNLRDYSKVGAEVFIQDQEGNTYDQILNKYGVIEGLHLSLTDKPLSLAIKLPGHFKTIYDFNIGMRNSTGELIGQYKRLDVPTSLGGDVNGDDVIDIIDAISIQANWGTNYRDADINFDGTIDAKDLAYVEKNYLMQNPNVKDAPKPKDKFKTQTLENIKSELGLK